MNSIYELMFSSSIYLLLDVLVIYPEQFIRKDVVFDVGVIHKFMWERDI